MRQQLQLRGDHHQHPPETRRLCQKHHSTQHGDANHAVSHAGLAGSMTLQASGLGSCLASGQQALAMIVAQWGQIARVCGCPSAGLATRHPSLATRQYLTHGGSSNALEAVAGQPILCPPPPHLCSRTQTPHKTMLAHRSQTLQESDCGVPGTSWSMMDASQPLGLQ